MALTLLRHAPLPSKYQKTFIGHTDVDIDLCLVDKKRLESIKNRSFDIVFSSDLKRCKQTLELLNFNFTLDKRLREVEFKKEFECKRFEEVVKMDSYDEKYLSSMKTWHGFICKESFESFHNRTKSFLEDLPKDKDILVCTHGGTIKMMSSILNGVDYNETIEKVAYLDIIEFNIS